MFIGSTSAKLDPAPSSLALSLFFNTPTISSDWKFIGRHLERAWFMLLAFRRSNAASSSKKVNWHKYSYRDFIPNGDVYGLIAFNNVFCLHFNLGMVLLNFKGKLIPEEEEVDEVLRLRLWWGEEACWGILFILCGCLIGECISNITSRRRDLLAKVESNFMCHFNGF